MSERKRSGGVMSDQDQGFDNEGMLDVGGGKTKVFTNGNGTTSSEYVNLNELDQGTSVNHLSLPKKDKKLEVDKLRVIASEEGSSSQPQIPQSSNLHHQQHHTQLKKRGRVQSRSGKPVRLIKSLKCKTKFHKQRLTNAREAVLALMRDEILTPLLHSNN